MGKLEWSSKNTLEFSNARQICATLFVLEQTNGNQFVQSYAPTFYVSQGWGSSSFTYSTIGQVIGIVGCAASLMLIDTTGRRPPMIGGSAVCTLLLYLAAGLGTEKDPNRNEANTILACFMLLPAFTRLSASTTAFLTGAEIGGVRLRKKTMVGFNRYIFERMTWC
jgi:MFS transporter, SP family, sugar:H+ symporter